MLWWHPDVTPVSPGVIRVSSQRHPTVVQDSSGEAKAELCKSIPEECQEKPQGESWAASFLLWKPWEQSAHERLPWKPWEQSAGPHGWGEAQGGMRDFKTFVLQPNRCFLFKMRRSQPSLAPFIQL